jgi:uncharacterized short protein YbdD (DUF466 family)
VTAKDAVLTARQKIDRAACSLRRVIGVPDYDIYLAHIREHHPDEKPLTREEFTNQRLVDKYSRPGSRCC